jgi:hydroxyacylglutathione hydrolase
MSIIRTKSCYLASNMYIIVEDNKAIIIDPYYSYNCIKDGLKIELIFLTHEHYDHISGVNKYRDIFGCKVLCSYECSKRVKNPRLNMSAYFDMFTSIPEFESYCDKASHVEPYNCSADEAIEDNQVIAWGEHQIKAIETPGHTLSSMCYLLDDKWLFAGDTLFADIDTMTRFPTGSEEDFTNRTLKKLAQLPKEVIVYPGHFESFILGERLERINHFKK